MKFYVATCVRHRSPYELQRRYAERQLKKLRTRLIAIPNFDSEWEIKYYEAEGAANLVFQCIEDFDSLPCVEGPIRAIISDRGRFECPELENG